MRKLVEDFRQSSDLDTLKILQTSCTLYLPQSSVWYMRGVQCMFLKFINSYGDNI